MTDDTKKTWTIKIEREGECEESRWVIRYKDRIYAEHDKYFFYTAPVPLIVEIIEKMLNDANDIAMLENRK